MQARAALSRCPHDSRHLTCPTTDTRSPRALHGKADFVLTLLLHFHGGGLSPRALDVPQYELFTFLCVFVSFFADPFLGVKRNGFSYILSRKKALGMEVLVPAAGFVPFRAAQSHLLPPSSVPLQGFQYRELFQGQPPDVCPALGQPKPWAMWGNHVPRQHCHM